MTTLKVLKDDPVFAAGTARCVRCSICTLHCPSYRVFRTEGNSPRGRVQLMRASMLGKLEADAGFEQLMDNCLGCRACEDVCPSAVPVGYLIDKTRAALLETKQHRFRKAATRIGLRMLARRGSLNFTSRLLRVIQLLWLDRLVRWIVRPFSRKAAQRLDGMPRVSGSPFDPRKAPACADPTVDFFAGCVMASTLGDVQRSSVRVLEQSGHRVAIPRSQVCCGALHLHAGQREQAKALAKANLDAFPGDAPICVNSAGCSLAMKEYGELLPDDPRAKAFAARIRDLSELVGGVRVPALRIAVQEACHHHNVQKLRGSAAKLLEGLGATVIPLPRGAGCCGSAGLWAAENPEPARKLLDPLLDAIEESGCDVVVSSNPGCLIFLRAGLRDRGSRIRALHLGELLDPQDRSETAFALGSGPVPRQ